VALTLRYVLVATNTAYARRFSAMIVPQQKGLGNHRAKTAFIDSVRRDFGLPPLVSSDEPSATGARPVDEHERETG
jgi:hypothetical protein